jgi:large subunit ribosomal protein L23
VNTIQDKAIIQENDYKLILQPYLSEKSSRAQENRQYVFRVMDCAKKPEIKAAIERLFQVEVEGVQVSHVKGKQKVFKQTPGRRKGWKKAYVKLKEGHKIDIFEQE